MSDRGLTTLERAHLAEPGDSALAGELARRYARVGRVREAYRLCLQAGLTPSPEVAAALAEAQQLALSHLGSPDAQVATELDATGWRWRDLPSHLERPSLLPLRALNLPWRRLSARDLSAIGGLCSLEDLRLTGWDSASGSRLRLLEGLSALRLLALDYTSLQDMDLRALRSFPGLEEVRLAHCSTLSGRELETLSWLPRLRSLDLSYTHTRSEALSAFRGHASLEELRLQDCQALDDGALELLASCPRLRLLDLSFCQGVSARGREALARGRPGLKILA